MSTPSRPAVFLWHPGSMGDVLLALPAVRALRRAYPGHELLLVAKEEIGRLLRNCGEVDTLLSGEDQGLADLCAGLDRVQGTVGKALGRCEAAVCWLADRDGRIARSLDTLGIRHVVLRSPNDVAIRAVHQAERFLETLGPLAARVASPEPLRLPVALSEEGRRRLSSLRAAGKGPCVVIHPGSGSPHKCCAPALLAELITGLRHRGAFPVLLAGPADGDAAARLRDLVPATIPFVQGFDLQHAAGLLAAADLYIGHDSGMTHLAAGLAVPTVALFGPTDGERWAPRGRTVRVLTGSPCRCVGWPQVQACTAKPCLVIRVESVLEACCHVVTRLSQDQEVRATRLS